MDISKQSFKDRNQNSILIKPHTVFACYAFVLTAAACFAGTLGSRIMMAGITALFALLIFKPEYLLGPIMFFTIFDDFLLVASNASASRFLAIFFILGAAWSILQRGSIKKVTLYFLLLIAFAVLLSFYSTYGSTSLPISYILNVLLAITMLNLTATFPERIPELLYTYAVLTLVYIYFLLSKNGFDSLVEGSRMTIGEDVNSNALAMGLAMTMGVLVNHLIFFKKHTVVNVLLIAANLVALFLTGSRTALIASVVTAFLLYFINAQDSRSKRKAFLLLILSVVLLFAVYWGLEKFFPVLMERFTVENVEASGGTGRLDVWKAYFTELFPKYWFIGMGFAPSNLYYGISSLSTEAHGAHNIIVEILSRSGIVGMILYAGCVVGFFNTTSRKLQTNKALLLPLAMVITTLINGIGENVLTGRFLWFSLGLGYMLLNTKVQNDKKLSEGTHNG